MKSADVTQWEAERLKFLLFADLLDKTFPASHEHEQPGGDNIRTLLEECDQLRGRLERSERDSRVLREGIPGLIELFQAEPPEGRNYTEFEVSHEYPDGEAAAFVIEIIRKDRKTPHQLRREAEAECDRLRAELEQREIRACECSPEDACRFVRERDEARAQLASRPAPVAVEVPERIPQEHYDNSWEQNSQRLDGSTPQEVYEDGMNRGYELAIHFMRKSAVRSRILKDGEVAVPVGLLHDVEEALSVAGGLGPCGLGLLCQVQDALLSNRGATEGGENG